MKQWKRTLALLLGVVLTLALCAPVFAVEGDFSGKTVILHVNDMHSRVDANLGYASLKKRKDDYEKAGATVLVLDAGDTFHGLPIANLSSGEDIVDIMNEVGFTAMTPGNHDFNYGTERLKELSELCAFDLLSCNFTDKDGNLVFPAYKLYNDVAVVGVSTPETATKTNPKNVEGYDFHADELAKYVQDAVDQARAEGAKTVVILGHLGVDPSSEPYRSTDVIPQISGADVFVDGHSHTVLGTEGEKDADGNVLNYTSAGENVKDKDGKDVLLVQTGCYAETIGQVVLDGDAKEALLSATDDKDEGITKLIEGKMAEIQPMLDKVVGKTEVALDGEREHVRAMETNLGDLAADALRYVAESDVALTNGGGIRVSLDKGDITYGDVNSVFPFGNTVKKLEVTGQILQDALEHGVSALPEISGRFPQVSGMTFRVDANKETGRVSDVKVNGVPLDLAKTYTLATNDFTAAGGDGYDMLASCKVLEELGALDEALVNYIANGTAGMVDATYTESRGSIEIDLPAAAEPAAVEPATETAAQAGQAPTGAQTGSASFLWAACLLLAAAACLLRRKEA